MPLIQPFTPVPPGCSRAYVEERVQAAFPSDRQQPIVGLLRPSIRIWPKARSGNPTASCFGGLPAVPVGWSWPFEDGEPLIFLAQINCAEVFADIGENALPKTGLIAFFAGDPDIHGCGPTHGGAVYYFSDPAALKPAASPSFPGFAPLISCGLSFYSNFELPDHRSDAVAALGLSPSERDTYRKLRESVATAGFPDGWDRNWISKLFGWPDLVQEDLGNILWTRSKGPVSLFLQIGWYTNGIDSEGWDPGGTLYFRLSETNLATGKFEAAELEVQGT
jgi:hypothetical protein